MKQRISCSPFLFFGLNNSNGFGMLRKDPTPYCVEVTDRGRQCDHSGASLCIPSDSGKQRPQMRPPFSTDECVNLINNNESEIIKKTPQELCSVYEQAFQRLRSDL